MEFRSVGTCRIDPKQVFYRSNGSGRDSYVQHSTLTFHKSPSTAAFRRRLMNTSVNDPLRTPRLVFIPKPTSSIQSVQLSPMNTNREDSRSPSNNPHRKTMSVMNSTMRSVMVPEPKTFEQSWRPKQAFEGMYLQTLAPDYLRWAQLRLPKIEEFKERKLAKSQSSLTLRLSQPDQKKIKRKFRPGDKPQNNKPNLLDPLNLRTA